MKNHLFTLCGFLLLSVFVSCQSGGESNNESSSSSLARSAKGNEFISTEDKNLFLFTQVPDIYNGCEGKFAKSEEDLESGQFVFATDLRKTGVIAIDGRFVQLDFVSEHVSSSGREYYRFEGKGYRLSLEIKKTEEVDNQIRRYRGQLKVTDDNNLRKAIYLYGEIDC